MTWNTKDPRRYTGYQIGFHIIVCVTSPSVYRVFDAYVCHYKDGWRVDFDDHGDVASGLETDDDWPDGWVWTDAPPMAARAPARSRKEREEHLYSALAEGELE